MQVKIDNYVTITSYTVHDTLHIPGLPVWQLYVQRAALHDLLSSLMHESVTANNTQWQQLMYLIN